MYGISKRTKTTMKMRRKILTMLMRMIMMIMMRRIRRRRKHKKKNILNIRKQWTSNPLKPLKANERISVENEESNVDVWI